jgi:small-conductance mechanosensitive channel
MDFWNNRLILGNTLWQYGVCLAVWMVGTAALWSLHRWGFGRLKTWAEKTDTPLDDFLVAALQRLAVPLAAFGVFYLGLQGLVLPSSISKALLVAGAALLTFFGVRFLGQAVRFAVFDLWFRSRRDENLERQMWGLMPVFSAVLWGLGVVFLLDNLGFKVSTVVAGLGIGGVAVALASQAILGDLFSYFSILFDRPFEIGDFIVVGELMGTVEHVGIKTTRLRSLGGEQLVFANADLTGSRVRNFKRMEKRRVLFRLGVTYNTTTAQLEGIPELLKSVIASTPGTQFDRAHFFSYGDFSLIIEAVYYVLSADYNVYMDTQQRINLGVKKEFEARGIEFAFPTQTLHLLRDAPK